MEITQAALAKAFLMGFVYAHDLDDQAVRETLQETFEALYRGDAGPVVISTLEHGVTAKEAAWLRQARMAIELRVDIRKMQAMMETIDPSSPS